MTGPDHAGHDLAEPFRVLSDELFRSHDVGAALTELVHLATSTVPFCDWAGITQVTSERQDRFTTIAATDPIVRRADDLQYELQDGPCVDAALSDGVFQEPDLQASSRWPVFGAQVTAQTPVRSLLSLTVHPIPARAALNLYSAQPGVFTSESVDLATVFAAHAQVLLMLTRQTQRIVNLDRALITSRLIGNAVGILMYAHRISAEEAFDRLRKASSMLNRKVTDVATEVTDTGELPPLRRPRPDQDPTQR